MSDSFPGQDRSKICLSSKVHSACHLRDPHIRLRVVSWRRCKLQFTGCDSQRRVHQVVLVNAVTGAPWCCSCRSPLQLPCQPGGVQDCASTHGRQHRRAQASHTGKSFLRSLPKMCCHPAQNYCELPIAGCGSSLGLEQAFALVQGAVAATHMVQTFAKAGLPPGVLQLVTGERIIPLGGSTLAITQKTLFCLVKTYSAELA